MLSDTLDMIDWASAPQPPWNGPTAVPDALRRLAAAHSSEDAVAASHRFLSAVGNNHAGTYWPVAVVAVPFLGEVLRSGGDWARESTLDALIDLVGTFWPEPGHERVRITSGEDVSVRACLVAAASSLLPTVEELARDGEPGARVRQLAVDLLETLADASDPGAG